MFKKVIFIAAVTILASGAFGSAAALDVEGGIIQVFSYEAQIQEVGTVVSVDVQPTTLNLRSAGPPVNVTIQLPAGMSVNDIDPASIQMCQGPDPGPGLAPSDCKINGHKFCADFDRQAVQNMLSGYTDPTVILTVSGTFTGGGIFYGSAIIGVTP